ncbi:MAG: rubrerythrin family protein [Candidatus Aminicenantales bacterium]
MKKMTETNVKDAFAGESQAHVRYLSYSEKAAAEGRPNIARAFKAGAFSEQVHATNHLKTLSGIGTTAANLREAIAGETFEVEEMYPAYVDVAKLQEEKTALMFLNAALAAERVHAAIYREAQEALDKGADLEAKPIHVCSVCGFTMEGETPDKCPVCGAPKEKFTAF